VGVEVKSYAVARSTTGSSSVGISVVPAGLGVGTLDDGRALSTISNCVSSSVGAEVKAFAVDSFSTSSSSAGVSVFPVGLGVGAFDAAWKVGGAVSRFGMSAGSTQKSKPW